MIPSLTPPAVRPLPAGSPWAPIATLLLCLGTQPLFAATGAPATALQADTPQVDFKRQIEPILEQHCWKCHGEKKQKAGLRLDTKKAALLGADFGAEPVILPGDSSGSRLLQVIAAEDEDERMPPRAAALDSDQIELIRQWIQAGASWPDPTSKEQGLFTDHWAYRAPQPSPLPTPGQMDWVRNEIDRFVLQRLEAEGLEPSPEAERETLLRRLCLDLTGLPPTPQQIERFLADDSEQAYEDLVDRLLASPHYGERQARAWLDLARYADTNGYEKDERRSIWRYRDWVIDAYNADMGFEQFTLEQIAGDLLPNATLEQQIATGFHRNTMINAEGGVDPEESRVAAVMDRANTTGSVWLGSTLACAQCHTHKYDPFSHRDYYRLFAYFNSSEDVGPGDGPRLLAPTSQMQKREELAVAELAQLDLELSAWEASMETKLVQALAEASEREADWKQIVPSTYTSNEGSTLALLNEGTILSLGGNPSMGTYEFSFELPAGPALQRLRLEALTHPTLPEGGSARSTHQNFVLSEVHLDLLPLQAGAEEVPISLARASADYSQPGTPTWPAQATIDGRPGTGWAIGSGVGQPHQLVIELEAPLELVEGRRVRLRLDQNYGGAHMLGHLRFSVSSESGDGSPPFDGRIVQLLREAPLLGGEHDGVLREWFLRNTPLLKEPRDRKRELEARDPLPTTLVMRELETPRTTHILERGSFLSPGKAVTPGVPGVLPQPDADSPPNRLGLARWLTSPHNPLTARVTVNRLWDQVFGRGLVGTTEDFGTQGELPSHPALLDWLALQFQTDDWSTKRILRRMVLSATYRQASKLSEELRKRDPQNRLLARGARYRVEAEMVRDIALSASGLLNPNIGGPSVFPPQPEGVWQITYNADSWMTATDENRFRRGLYTFWRRTAPYPTFMAFDATSRELACLRRSPSNTPLQALALLNDPAFIEAAVALAGRSLRAPAARDEERMTLAFRRCTGRSPNAEEQRVLLQLLVAEREHYAMDPDAARQLIHSPAALGTEGLDPSELAAWTVVCNVLLNLDETITRS